MTDAPDHSRDRLAAVALFLLLVAGVLSLTFGAGYALFTQEREQALSVSNMTEKIRAVIDRQKASAAGLAGIDRQQLLDTVYLRAANPAVAVATLQDRVTTLAGAVGAQMRRISVNDGSGASGRVSVQVQLTGSLDQISSFLAAVEANRPLLSIDKISLNRLRARRRKSGGNTVEVQQFASLMTLSVALRIGGS